MPALSMLLDAAACSGEIRGDVAPCDLLCAIGNFAVASGMMGWHTPNGWLCYSRWPALRCEEAK